MYDMIKKYYDLGIYHKEDLIIFIKAGYITQSQYNEIIGSN